MPGDRETGEGQVLLYDLERYGGEDRAPGYKRGDVPRFLLNAYYRQPGKTFHVFLWADSAATLEEARARVPDGGAYFDRTGNYPSPMVPIEGWRFECRPPEPPRTEQAATP